jgi:chemotaxis protein CheD
MITQTDNSPAVKYLLEPGYIYLPAKPATISAVLGSAVSVCLYDRKRSVGGMNHYPFPFTAESARATACYGNVAIIALMRMMLDDGSRRKHLEAQIIGGAHNPNVSEKDIGRENVRIARKILLREKVALVSEDTGGVKGRKIVFTTDTNDIAVIKVAKLRRGDWYPYEHRR